MPLQHVFSNFPSELCNITLVQHSAPATGFVGFHLSPQPEDRGPLRDWTGHLKRDMFGDEKYFLFLALSNLQYSPHTICLCYDLQPRCFPETISSTHNQRGNLVVLMATCKGASRKDALQLHERCNAGPVAIEAGHSSLIGMHASKLTK